MKFSTKKIIICSLFTAITSILAQISIPLPFTPVPINMGTLAVLMSGIMLGKNYGALSQIVYLLLGITGLPVFSNFTGGIGKLLGPTGGYLIGYVLAAYTIGLIATKSNKRTVYVISMVAGMLICYIFGTAWFMYLTKNPLLTSLTMCVFPFLIGDSFKILATLFICSKLQRIKEFKIFRN